MKNIVPVILFLLLCITLISITKKSGSPVSGFKARFGAFPDGTPMLNIKYTNPTSFVNVTNTNSIKAILYVTECNNCQTTEDHPMPADIAANNLYKKVTIDDGLYTDSTSIRTAGASLEANIPVSTKTDFDLIGGKTYKIGIALMGDSPSKYTTGTSLPNIYGNFVYVTALFGDLPGPGIVTGLSGDFK